MWGVPADENHDTRRPLPGECVGLAMESCTLPPRPTGTWPLPFLTNPTRCGVPLSVALTLSTYEHPKAFVTSTGSMTPTTGCSALPFGPKLQVGLATAETRSTSGIDLELSLAETEGLALLEPAAVRWLDLELPLGFGIDPKALAALGVCADSEFALGSDEPAACPKASRIGTASLALAGFDTPLIGEAFFGTALGDVQRILLDTSGPLGRVKLEVDLEPELEGAAPFSR